MEENINMSRFTGKKVEFDKFGKISSILTYVNDKLDGKQLYFQPCSCKHLPVFHNLSDSTVFHLYDIINKYEANKKTIKHMPRAFALEILKDSKCKWYYDSKICLHNIEYYEDGELITNTGFSFHENGTLESFYNKNVSVSYFDNGELCEICFEYDDEIESDYLRSDFECDDDEFTRIRKKLLRLGFGNHGELRYEKKQGIRKYIYYDEYHNHEFLLSSIIEILTRNFYDNNRIESVSEYEKRIEKYYENGALKEYKNGSHHHIEKYMNGFLKSEWCDDGTFYGTNHYDENGIYINTTPDIFWENFQFFNGVDKIDFTYLHGENNKRFYTIRIGGEKVLTYVIVIGKNKSVLCDKKLGENVNELYKYYLTEYLFSNNIKLGGTSEINSIDDAIDIISEYDSKSLAYTLLRHIILEHTLLLIRKNNKKMMNIRENIKEYELEKD